MSTEEAPEQRSRIIAEMAEAVGIDPKLYWKALKGAAGCGTYKGADGKWYEIATDAEFLVLLYFAKTYKLDPLAREVGLIAGKGDKPAKPYVEFNGWMRVLVSHADYKAHGWRYNWTDRAKMDLGSVTFWIARKSMAGTPYEVSEHEEFMSSCRPDPVENWSPWKRWAPRMLAEKAAMQGTRFTFGLYMPSRDDIEQAMAGEAGRTEATTVAAENAPPAQGPIAPAAPIAGAKRARKKAAEPELPALPPPDVAGQTTIDDFLRGKSEPVPVMTHPEPMASALAAAVADLPGPTDRATLPAYDPAESRRVDEALTKADADDFDDILS